MKKLKRTILLILTVFTLGISNAKAMDAELAYLTATLFGEAGGEGIEGIQTVASVIANRRNYYQTKSKGGTIKLSDVCLARYQFSFWNDKHNWTINDIERWASRLTGANARAWKNCLTIAQQAIAGTMKDITNGATFYYATWMDKAGATPSWGRTKNFKLVGHHKLIYGVGLAPLKTWGSAKSIAGGGGGGSWDGNLPGGGAGMLSSADPFQKFQGYPDECKNAPQKNSSIVSNEIMKHRLFAEDILINMQDMMLKIYKSLSVLFARGHALMCFSTKVSPLCLDAAGSNIISAAKSLISCSIKIPLLNYFIPGLLIYITGFFMCMSIGMYFVDISFKLGFAVLFLPITLALWPFPPTQSKFTENVSSIINSAMLFAFAAVGTAYAVILIDACLGSSADFWRVIDNASKTFSGNEGIIEHAAKSFFADKDNSMEKFSEAYSISSINILVILFALIFGFKILASSINNYLNTFFGDGMLGAADSTMHHMGTQAVGFIKNHTVDPVARYARDVAMFQGGKALEGAGNMLAKVRPNSKFGASATNPTTNSNHSPTPMRPNTNSSTQNANDEFVDDDDTQTTPDIDVNANSADNTQTTPNTFANNEKDSPNKNDEDNGIHTDKNTRSKTPDSKNFENNKQNVSPNDVTDKKSGEQGFKTHQTQAAGGADNPTGTAQKQDANNASEANNANNENATSESTLQQINEFTRPTGHSLTVGNAFKAVAHPQQAYRTVKQLAQQGVQDWQNADSLKDKGKLVIKKSGQVVMRSVRGNATEAASATIGVTSGFLRAVGRKMQKKPAEWQKERQNGGYGAGTANYEGAEQEAEAQYQREQEEINNSYNS